MYVRFLAFFLLTILLFSCGNISHNTTTSKNQQKLLDTVIDYTSVDVYPLFTNCNETDEKHNQEECFAHAMTKRLEKTIKSIDYKVRKPVNDSALVKLLVNDNGKTRLVAIESPQIITDNLPQLDSVIRASVDALPIVKPAVKRGIPIKSQYHLAIVVRTIE